MIQQLKQQLHKHGWINSDLATLTPLTGGVSSNIYLVEDNGRRFVVKQALEKLKVSADWFADTNRNATEQAYIRYVREFRPDAMPDILGANTESGFFVMEYLDGLKNWKESLLAGSCDTSLAHRAGKLLGEIHARSWGDEDLMNQFDTMSNFDQLRIDPYLRATAQKHHQLRSSILSEANRLTQSRQCLIHGDYSPKNILFNDQRIVPLDCEVACYADAAFDLSFFLNHLFLKSGYHRSPALDFNGLINAARAGYRETNREHADDVEARCSILLPMLMLARVDGKSPVEYLNSTQQNFVRERVAEQLSSGPDHLSHFQLRWFEALYR